MDDMDEMTEEEAEEEMESRRLQSAYLEYGRRKREMYDRGIMMTDSEYREWVKRTVDELKI